MFWSALKLLSNVKWISKAVYNDNQVQCYSNCGPLAWYRFASDWLQGYGLITGIIITDYNTRSTNG